MEDGESIAQAATRETKEETGLDVELARLVGIYSRLSNMAQVHAVLFSAKLIGGEIKCQPGETIAVEWFEFDKLPAPLSAGHKRRIDDAVSGVCGVTVMQEFKIQSMPENLTRQELYEYRDRSGLSRQEFYLKMMEDSEIKETVELSGV